MRSNWNSSFSTSFMTFCRKLTGLLPRPRLAGLDPRPFRRHQFVEHDVVGLEQLVELIVVLVLPTCTAPIRSTCTAGSCPRLRHIAGHGRFQRQRLLAGRRAERAGTSSPSSAAGRRRRVRLRFVTSTRRRSAQPRHGVGPEGRTSQLLRIVSCFDHSINQSTRPNSDGLARYIGRITPL